LSQKVLFRLLKHFSRLLSERPRPFETVQKVTFTESGLDPTGHLVGRLLMPWSVLFCEEFVEDFAAMPEGWQDEVRANAGFLEEFGPTLGRPKVDTLQGSTFPNMKELRFDWMNGVWRIAFAFDPQRKAILLVGGDKRGADQRQFYRNLVRQADERYQRHLDKLAEASHGKNS
jgi:hypothetical protein